MLREKILDISLVFILLCYLKVPKTIRINDERELQQIASNHSSDIDFKYFMKFYKHYTKQLYSFLENDPTLSSDNPLRFRKNLL